MYTLSICKCICYPHILSIGKCICYLHIVSICKCIWYLRILSIYICICYLYINDTGYRIYDTSCREDPWDLGRTRARTINTERHLTHQHRTYISQSIVCDIWSIHLSRAQIQCIHGICSAQGVHDIWSTRTPQTTRSGKLLIKRSPSLTLTHRDVMRYTARDMWHVTCGTPYAIGYSLSNVCSISLYWSVKCVLLAGVDTCDVMRYKARMIGSWNSGGSLSYKSLSLLL